MKFEFKKKVLANGLTILFEKRDIPVVSVAYAVRCGGMNESAEEKGISHFVEHMLYKGTPLRSSKKIAQEIELKGGEMNGFTDENITAYWCKMPSEHLKIALDVLTDMIKNSLFDEKEIEKERKVIFEEMKMRRDNPRSHVLDEINSFLYEKPFGISLIGTKESMNSITREKIFKKFKEVYTPNNLILCVVGDADFGEIVKFAERNFGKEKNRVANYKIKLRNEIKIEKRKGVDQANFIFAFHTPLSDDKRNRAVYVLMTLIAGGMSSRLFQEIREKRNLAYSINGDARVNKEFSFCLIYVGTTKDKVQEVKKLILEEFEKVSKGLDESELENIKERIVGNYKISMEDSQMQMVNLLYYEVDGDAKRYYDYEKEILDVKLKDVKEIAASVKKGYSFYALIPED